MVEMRWLQRPANIKDKHMIEDSCGYLMVLQYRQQIGVSLIKGEGGIEGMERKWSEWIDVPTVTEG